MIGIVARPGLLIGGVALTGAAPAAPPERYLTGNGVDLRDVLPLPPLRGSELEKRDRAMFRTGRPSVGNPRWRMAASDVDEGTTAMFHDYSDAIGIALAPDR